MSKEIIRKKSYSGVRRGTGKKRKTGGERADIPVGEKRRRGRGRGQKKGWKARSVGGRRGEMLRGGRQERRLWKRKWKETDRIVSAGCVNFWVVINQSPLTLRWVRREWESLHLITDALNLAAWQRAVTCGLVTSLLNAAHNTTQHSHAFYFSFPWQTTC